MEAVVVVIRSRRCFGGRVYSLGAWQPAATKTGIALRERRVRAHSVGNQSVRSNISYHSIYEGAVPTHYITLEFILVYYFNLVTSMESQ